MKERSSPLLCSDARPVYAIFLPLDSKLPHLPRPDSSFDRFIGFSPLSIYIYILYIGNEDFLRRLWRCGGFLEDWHDHGANTLACLSDEDVEGEEEPFARERKGGKEGMRDTYQFHLIQRFLAVCCSRYITNCFADPLEEPLAQRTEKILELFIP